MADVFLSYTHEDVERAKQIARVLEAKGWSVWWDRSIRLGLPYDEVIERELRGSSCVVVLWSRTSVSSRWVKAEATDAAEAGTLIPVRIDRDAKIPMAFRMLECADLSDWNGADDSQDLWQVTMALTTLVRPAQTRSRAEADVRSGQNQTDVAFVVCSECQESHAETFLFCPRCGFDRGTTEGGVDPQVIRMTALLRKALASRYDVGPLLGRGASAFVFLATDRERAEKVAVKAYPPELMTGMASDRFKRAARISRTVQHPHLVNVLTAGIAEGIGFFVMRYMSNGSLADLIVSKAGLPARRLVAQLLPVVDALALLHEHDVIHRDIKPSNVLIDKHNQAGLTDLGNAKLRDDDEKDKRLTATGQIVGTPVYLSPELFSGEEATSATDQWALGVTLYQALAGRLPFDGVSVQSVFVAIVTSQQTPLSEVSGEIPNTISDVVERMLRKNPADRFPSMRAVHDALRDSLVDDEAIITPPPAAAPRR